MRTESMRVLVAILLLGCGRGDARVPPGDEPGGGSGSVASGGVHATAEVRLLAIGDSFTIGTGSSPEQAFPARLAERWRAAGCTVTLRNVAVNGYATADVVERELPEIGPFAPTWVTLAVGANDVVRSVPEATYRANVALILSKIVAAVAPAHVLVLPQPEWPRSKTGAAFGDPDALAATVDRFDEILRDESSRVGARFVDLSPLMRKQADASMLAPDGLHPSAEAHAEWAEAIARAVPSPCTAP